MKKLIEDWVDGLFPISVAVLGGIGFVVIVCAIIAGPIILVLWGIKALFMS